MIELIEENMHSWGSITCDRLHVQSRMAGPRRAIVFLRVVLLAV